MNTHMTTPEYAVGYVDFMLNRPCPWTPGTTAKMLWMEGNADARDDERNNGWISVILYPPPEGLIVETSIRDLKGIRNEQQLKRYKRLYFFPDGKAYVYYTPTHWRRVS